MLVGLLGVAGFILGLFVIGAIAEHDGRKALRYGAALAVCVVVIIAVAPPASLTDADCWIDWDARSNSTVCD